MQIGLLGQAQAGKRGQSTLQSGPVMARILMAKKLKALYPIDDTGEDVIRRIGQGEVVAVEVKKPRNVRFHRKFFAMLQLVLENQSHYKSLDDLLDVCKLQTGHFRTVQTKQGKVLLPSSISFAAMDDTEFGVFYDKACQWVMDEVIPGLKRADLDSEVEAQLMAFGGV